MFLQFAHQTWKTHLKPGAIAIDATCGNGYDTRALAELNPSHLYVFDIQEKALKAAKEKTQGFKNISYHLQCHSNFDLIEGLVALIVYNLGYLPGGDKSLTTSVKTTLQSLKNGLDILKMGGMISCMLYPGHLEGFKEKSSVLKLAQVLSPEKFQVSHHTHLNRSKAPSLLLIQKIS